MRRLCVLVAACENQGMKGATAYFAVSRVIFSPYLTLMVSGEELELEIKRFLKMARQPGLATGVFVFSDDICWVERLSGKNKWKRWNRQMEHGGMNKKRKNGVGRVYGWRCD